MDYCQEYQQEMEQNQGVDQVYHQEVHEMIHVTENLAHLSPLLDCQLVVSVFSFLGQETGSQKILCLFLAFFLFSGDVKDSPVLLSRGFFFPWFG